MIEISIPDSVDAVIINLNAFDKDAMLREIAVNIMPMIRKRVHVDGLDADGSQIGTYTKEYMKVRTGNFQENTITRGKNKGQARPAYNRSADTKVILSLTSQMEQDMQVIKTDNGYGIGYSNEFNYNKAMWNEKRYKKNIWNLSADELDIMEAISERYIIEKLNG